MVTFFETFVNYKNFISDIVIACGLVIDGLTAQTCDASWIPGLTTWNSMDASWKLMELSDLAFYWNEISKEKMFYNLNLSELAVKYIYGLFL